MDEEFYLRFPLIIFRGCYTYLLMVSRLETAKLVKMRFDQDTITRLEKSAWWDWERGKIERFLPLLMNGDIQAFLDSAENELDECVFRVKD